MSEAPDIPTRPLHRKKERQAWLLPFTWHLIIALVIVVSAMLLISRPTVKVYYVPEGALTTTTQYHVPPTGSTSTTGDNTKVTP